MSINFKSKITERTKQNSFVSKRFHFYFCCRSFFSKIVAWLRKFWRRLLKFFRFTLFPLLLKRKLHSWHFSDKTFGFELFRRKLRKFDEDFGTRTFVFRPKNPILGIKNIGFSLRRRRWSFVTLKISDPRKVLLEPKFLLTIFQRKGS